ncbi:MAG: heme ABC exporter ATP-binding protein CcmA [Chloroflexi bacterium]|nr:heme ABC exporter ATP-binding protein CcmA [Chloroflexota bacterium]
MIPAAAGIPLPPGIEAHNLTKFYGLNGALRGIDLEVTPGDVLVIFGPNGAGKSTLIRILSTLSRPTSGTVNIGGLDLARQSNQIRRRIGVVTHQTLLYDELSAYENLKFYGRMFQVPDLEDRIKSLIAEVGLESRLSHRVRTFSRGMQQRLSLARALLHDPPILMLDEPETGLDRQAANLLGDRICDYRAHKRTVIVTTHHLEHGLELSSRIAVMYKGRLAFQENRQGLNAGSFIKEYCQLIGADQ